MITTWTAIGQPSDKAECPLWVAGSTDRRRALERRNKSGVYRILALNGGIAPEPAGELRER
jgi:hypothetical protein